jgi:hypothetical protein
MQLFRVTSGGPGKRLHVHRDQVVRDEIAHAGEPETRQLRQHLALVGNAGAEHVVERGDAIGRDDQQAIVDLVDVAHLATAVECQAFEFSVEQWCGRYQA